MAQYVLFARDGIYFDDYNDIMYSLTGSEYKSIGFVTHSGYWKLKINERGKNDINFFFPNPEKVTKALDEMGCQDNCIAFLAKVANSGCLDQHTEEICKKYELGVRVIDSPDYSAKS
jgi:hypothetical protein